METKRTTSQLGYTITINYRKDRKGDHTCWGVKISDPSGQNLKVTNANRDGFKYCYTKYGAKHLGIRLAKRNAANTAATNRNGVQETFSI